MREVQVSAGQVRQAKSRNGNDIGRHAAGEESAVSDFRLPANLKRHFVNLSVTIQQLITEIVLTIEGMPAQENRAEDAKLEQSARARRANEAICNKLRDFIAAHQLLNDDAAIAMATANGRSTGEISDFLGLEQRYVRSRVHAIRKSADKWTAPPHTGADAYSDGASVIEIFAEAQRVPTKRRMNNLNADGMPFENPSFTPNSTDKERRIK